LADALGLPCKSSNPKNIPFYNRHGFVTIEELYVFENDPMVEGKGPVATPTIRESQSKKDQ